MLDGCILLFTCESIVSFDCCLLSVGGFINFGFSLRFSVRYWVDRCNSGLALTLFSRHIGIVGCSIDGVFSGLCSIVNFLNSCILLFTSEGVISFNCCFLSVGGFINFGLSLRFSVGYWVHCVDCCFTLALFSCYIGVCGCVVNRVFSGLGGVIHLLDGCILLFTCEGVISFDGCFLGVSCFINFCLSFWLSVCYWVHCVNRCFTLALLGCYIRVSGCGVNGIFSCLRGVVHLLNSCILLFTS